VVLDLSGLTETQKDALILEQHAKIVALEEMVAELQARLAADSHNSNKPPSSNGFRQPPKPKSLREKSGKKSGGQPGNLGKTLERSENPNYVVDHTPPAHCDDCAAELPAPTVAETRQVFDLPEIDFEVTEHRTLEVKCRCGKVHRGTFPKDVTAPVQYGPRVLATLVYLTNQQMLPLQRTTEVMNDLFGLPVAESTIVAASVEASERLQPTIDRMASSFEEAPVVHADETGCKINGKNFWIHAAVTTLITLLGIHKKRGMEAMTELGVLIKCIGILVHDGWDSYRKLESLNCLHALCNAHHLRELVALFEEGQAWAGRMIELLRSACHEVNEAPENVLSETRHHWYRTQYEEILAEGDRDHPWVPSPPGKRGRPKQSKATNLLCRLREYMDDVWRFSREPLVPFTNNLAEQAVRMPKVKLKISGGFRTEKGARIFCLIRSYLDTMRKQEVNRYQALVSTFQGEVPQPRLH
jgi:transposase